MNAAFLSIDLKKASSDTQIGKALSTFISTQELYQVSDFQEAINEVDKLRENLRQAAEKKENLLNVYLRYFSLLYSIEKRFPINEQEVRINFVWYDIFKQKKVSKMSIQYEKACVLFNIAALQSQLAVQESIEHADGIKNACKFFRMSSGTFEQLKELLEGNPDAAAAEDLSGDVLLTLTNLMLAQAQELYYLMGLKQNMQPTAISKLAAQTSDFYNSTMDLMSGANVKSKIPKKWSAFVEVKRDVMKAVAHYQLGKHIKISKQYGEELSRYKIAVKYMSTYAKSKSVVPELSHYVDELIGKINSACAAAQKDNDTIYHEPTLPEHKLPQLEKKVMVKSEKLPDEKLKIAATADPFAKLVPFKVRKADSIYSERKAEILRSITTKVEESNNKIKNVLHFDLGLPGALEAIETPHGIPQSLMQKMDAVGRQGGTNSLKEKLDLLRKLFKEDNVILDQSFQLLDDEEKDDLEMRKQYGEKWNRTPSHTLSSNLRLEGQKYKANLEHASKSDNYIEKLIEDNEKSIELLGGTQGQVLNMLPETARQDVSVTKLKELCKQLDESLYKQDNLLVKLREHINTEDIIDKLVKVQEFEYETVFAQELEKFQPQVSDLNKLMASQEELLLLIKEENNKFVQQRQSNTQLMHRQQVLQEFENAYASYCQIKDHLTEGAQFYSNFQEILRKFKTKCSDLVFARKTEKQDLLQDIQHQNTNYTVTTFTSQQGIPPPYNTPYQSTPQHPQQQSYPPPYQQHHTQQQHYSASQNPYQQHHPQHLSQQQQFYPGNYQQQKPPAFPPNPYGNLDK